MLALATGCGSLAVDPSGEPELSASRQQQPGPPESPVLADLRSAEWAQAHGLPVNPHRGKGPSITFYGPRGTIRRHVELSESDLRPRASFQAADVSTPSLSGSRFEEAAAPALLVRQGELTDSFVTIGSTEQYWVFEDGILLTKTLLVIDADTVVGASQLALDALGEVAAELWVPRSAMGPIDDPEDLQWEIGFPWTPRSDGLRTALASCPANATFDACSEAITYAAGAGIILAGAAAVCWKFRFACGWAKHRGRVFKGAVAVVIAACGWEWATVNPWTGREPTAHRLRGSSV